MANSLRGATAGDQAVVGGVQQQELVDVGGLHQLVGAGLDPWRRVAAGVVGDRPGDVAPQLGQVAGQLVDPVDGAQVDLARLVVDHQVGEASFRWEEGEQGGGGGGRRGCGGCRQGEKEEEE